MSIIPTDLDGRPLPPSELTRDAALQLWLDEEPVLAISHAGNRMMLTLSERIVLIDAGAYWHLLRGDAEPGAG